MAILWLDKSSGPTLNALDEGYAISNPKAGENTHLIDHTWLALVATAGMSMIEYHFVRQADGWQRRAVVGGEESANDTIDSSMFEEVLSLDLAGGTMIVQVEHTPGRMTSDEYAEGEHVTIIVTIPIHASLQSLRSDFSSLQGFVGGFTADKEILEGKVFTLESDNSTLNATVSTLESDSETLNTTVSQLEEDVTNLSTANSTLEGKVSTLESDNASLSSTVSGLETNFGSLSSANDTLNSTVSTLEGNVTTLTSDKEALEGQVSTLESTIADLTARLEALENPTNPE